MKKLLVGCAALLLALSAPAGADPSLPSDQAQELSDDELKTLVSECESCHGKGGVSTNSTIPSLAGKSAESILESIEQFYFYERHCPNAKNNGKGPKTGARNMCDVADHLTKQEAQAVARWFQAQ